MNTEKDEILDQTQETVTESEKKEKKPVTIIELLETKNIVK